MNAFFRSLGRSDKAAASVILRRQVPVRFDEPARSWLGGLPQMPDHIPWPRSAGNRLPLHFIAQIACADLPKRIWNGRGPRKGWLLLFVDVLRMEDSGEEDIDIDDAGLGELLRLAWQYGARWLGQFVPHNFGGASVVHVLHIDRIGPERQLPDDMTTMRHVMSDSTGRYEPAVREGVPKLFRRWPVDLVVQEAPPFPTEGSGIEWEPLPVTGAGLYGAPAVDDIIDRFADPDLRPLTWRGALYLVDGIMATMAEQPFDGLQGAPSSEEGWFAAGIARAETHIVSYEADAAKTAAHLRMLAGVGVGPLTLPMQGISMTPEQHAWCEDYIVRQHEAVAVERRNIADLSVFSRPGGEAALGAEMGRTARAHLQWRAEQPQVLESLRTRILGENLEAPLGAGGWSDLKAELTASPTEYWNKWDYAQRKVQRSLLDYGARWLAMAQREDILDLYTRDAAARAVIPPALLTEVEPKLRRLEPMFSPHRMGGPRDVLQGYASPADDDLLFQIYSDDTMGWQWGDVGALCVYLRPINLKLRWFRNVHARLDGH